MTKPPGQLGVVDPSSVDVAPGDSSSRFRMTPFSSTDSEGALDDVVEASTAPPSAPGPAPYEDG